MKKQCEFSKTLFRFQSSSNKETVKRWSKSDKMLRNDTLGVILEISYLIFFSKKTFFYPSKLIKFFNLDKNFVFKK